MRRPTLTLRGMDRALANILNKFASAFGLLLLVAFGGLAILLLITTFRS